MSDREPDREPGLGRERAPFEVPGYGDITQMQHALGEEFDLQVPDYKKKSHFWNAFHIGLSDTGGPIAVCNVCGCIVSTKNGSTSSLTRHLERKHKEVAMALMPEKFGLPPLELPKPKPKPPKPAKKRPKVEHYDEEEDEYLEGVDLEREPFEVSGYGDITEVQHGLEEEFDLQVPDSSKKSLFWNAFRVGKSHRGPIACCNICGAVMSTKNGSTSSLTRHLDKKHSEVALALMPEKYGAAPIRKQAKKQKLKSKRGKLSRMKGERGRKSGANKITPEQAQNVIGHAVTQWIVSRNQALQEVLTDEFTQMLKKVRSHGKALPEDDLQFDEAYVQTEIVKAKGKVKEKIMERLKGKPLIGSMDHWVSRNNENYTSLTATLIEDFELVTLTLEVKASATTESQSPDNVHEYNERWKAWGIDLEDRKNVPYIVTDTKMNDFGIDLQEKFGTEQIYCIDHDLQVIANVVFNSKFFGDADNGDNTELLKKARTLVATFSGSSQNADHLKQAQVALSRGDGDDDDEEEEEGISYDEALELIPDTVPRWWSTYKMTLRLLQLKKSLELLLEEGHFPPDHSHNWLSENEWSVLEQIMLVLKPLANAQKFLEGQKYTSVSLIPLFLPEIQSRLEYNAYSPEDEDANNDDEYVKECSVEMLEAFGIRFGNLQEPFQENVERGYGNRQVGLNKAVYFAFMLDPRLKHLGILQLNVGQEEEFTDALLKQMIANETAFRAQEEEREAKREAEQDGTATNSAAETPARKKRRGGGDQYGNYDDDNEFKDLIVQVNQIKTHSERKAAEIAASEGMQTIQQTCQLELQNYLKERGISLLVQEEEVSNNNEDQKYNNPFEWWKSKASNFPILWRLAKIYLAIPATSVPPKAAFRVPEENITPDRARWKPEVVGDIMFLNRNRSSLQQAKG